VQVIATTARLAANARRKLGSLATSTYHCVVDPVGSQRFFARAGAPDRAFCLYPGLYHEIFNEVDHEKVFQDIESWLTQRTNGQLTGWNPPP